LFGHRLHVPGITLLANSCRERLAIPTSSPSSVSLHTNDDNHDVSGYWILTGYPTVRQPARSRPNDWPYFGSIIKMLKPSERLPALTSVWVPT